MSPLPTETADHWWQRPGRLPGRELYHWHMLLHNQPAVRELVANVQQRLVGIPGLDIVPLQWLHVTTYIVAFADEITDQSVNAMVEHARQSLRHIAPIDITISRIFYHPTAVTLALEPFDALSPVLKAVRDATCSIGCEGRTDTDPWIPHISVAYSNTVRPAAPVIAALGRRVPLITATMSSINLVAQTQVGRSWQWRSIAEVSFGPDHPRRDASAGSGQGGAAAPPAG